MIQVENLHFAFRGREVLRGVTFQMEAGSVHFLLGANGAGKTTLFRCMLGLLPLSEGHVWLDGQDAARMTPKELASRMAYIPQSHAPVFDYTVLDMVLMGVSRTLRLLGVPGERERETARWALGRVNALALEERAYRQLSGGEQQLVLIARALAQRAGILLMDEPTANLDYGNQLRVLECVTQLAREGYTVMISSHNPQHALWYGDGVLALDGGAVVAQGAPQTQITEALIRRLYGIETTFADANGQRMIVPTRTEKGENHAENRHWTDADRAALGG